MSYDAFISHKSERKSWVTILAKNLKNSGVRVFFDDWDLVPGRSLATQLDEALGASRKGILVATPEVASSGWIRDEYERMLGLKQKKTGFSIVPIRIGKEIAEMPFLSNLLYVDFPGCEQYAASFHRLLCALRDQPPVPIDGLELPAPELFISRPQTDLRFGAQDLEIDVFEKLQTRRAVLLCAQVEKMRQSQPPAHYLRYVRQPESIGRYGDSDSNHGDFERSSVRRRVVEPAAQRQLGVERDGFGIKLSRAGEYLGLFSADSSRQIVSELANIPNCGTTIRSGWSSAVLGAISGLQPRARKTAWERPVSAELIRLEDNGGFQAECGIRIQGGDYVRQRYDSRGSLPYSKFSYRICFLSEISTNTRPARIREITKAVLTSSRGSRQAANKSYSVQFRDQTTAGTWLRMLDIPVATTNRIFEISEQIQPAQEWRLYQVVSSQQRLQRPARSDREANRFRTISVIFPPRADKLGLASILIPG